MRWLCDAVFAATSSEEGHNICKTAMPASVPTIGFRCSRSLRPCLRKSLCADKLGIDIYHIDMTMFCFPMVSSERANFCSETSKCRTYAGRCVRRQPCLTSTKIYQSPSGASTWRGDFWVTGDPTAMTRSQDIVSSYTPSYTLLNLSLLERRYFL